MSKIQGIKPDLFVDDALFDAEQSYGLPLRYALMGLLTFCDHKGNFRWQPRRLKNQILPYDSVDFSTLLEALAKTGFIRKYEEQGLAYGCISSESDRLKMLSTPVSKPINIPAFLQGEPHV